MQFYIADYLADTAHLSTLEHGAYLLLIMNYWQRGGPLPEDEIKLCRIAHLSPREWRKVGPEVMKFFTITSNGWEHKRVERELDAFRTKSDHARNAGLASAQRRANGRSTDVQRTFNHTDTDNKIKTPLPPKGEDSEFKAFCLAYPKRLGADPAKPASQKFAAAKKRGVSGPMMIAGAKAYAVEIREAGKEGTEFVALKTTWLNQERWNDYAQKTNILSDERRAELIRSLAS
jgi:uncharacterized protein YdaU (DUF1376 family)